MNEGSTFEVTAQAGRKGVWRVSLDAEALTLAAVDGDESFQILRSEAEEKTRLCELCLMKPALVVSIPKTKKMVFKMEHAQAALDAPGRFHLFFVYFTGKHGVGDQCPGQGNIIGLAFDQNLFHDVGIDKSANHYYRHIDLALQGRCCF